mgnify:CR=1 FL=1
MERKKPKIIDDSEKSSDVMEDLEIINLYWIRSETALTNSAIQKVYVFLRVLM